MRFTVVLPAHFAETKADIFTVAAWRKEIGDLVRQGEALAIVTPLDSSTAAREIEIPSPVFGILARKSVLEGDGIESGEPLGVLSGVPEPLLPTAVPPSSFTAPASAAAGAEDTVPRSATEQLLALHNARSLRTSPHVTTAATVNLSEVLRLRARVAAGLTEREGITLDSLPFVLSVVGASLLRFPRLNAQLGANGDEIRLRRYVNLGFTAHGAVPVIRSPETMSILGLARTVADLKARARTHSLREGELRNATFTVTEAADSTGILWQTPIIHQPQAAILSIGATVQTPLVLDDGTIAVRPVLHLCLAHDARIVDSETASQFLAAVKQGLEEAQFLFA